MITIDNILSADQVATIMATLDTGDFEDGRRTTQKGSDELKRNLELKPDATRARLGKMILQAVQGNAEVNAYAFPSKFSFPMFSRYEPGMYYDFHTDAAIMNLGHPSAVRTDLSCTVFLSEPDSYDGGELTIESPSGTKQLRLPAGSAALYPTTNLHRVEEVSHGARVVAVFWIQSYVRDETQRQILLKLNRLCQDLSQNGAASHEQNLASSTVHDLLRMWAAA